MRYQYRPGLGIIDTETDDLYITLREVTGLLNRQDKKIQEAHKEWT